MGPFITQPGTPATDKWTALYPNANKNSHMKSMFDLTTAMNALVRITMGNVNISATTALQVRAGQAEPRRVTGASALNNRVCGAADAWMVSSSSVRRRTLRHLDLVR